jgi:hypothetical protein
MIADIDALFILLRLLTEGAICPGTDWVVRAACHILKHVKESAELTEQILKLTEQLLLERGEQD